MDRQHGQCIYTDGIEKPSIERIGRCGLSSNVPLLRTPNDVVGRCGVRVRLGICRERVENPSTMRGRGCNW